MRMSGGYVSQPLSLKAQNSKGYVSVTNEKKDSKSQKLFELAVSVEPAKNRVSSPDYHCSIDQQLITLSVLAHQSRDRVPSLLLREQDS